MRKRLFSVLLAGVMVCTLPAIQTIPVSAEAVTIKESPDKYTWYLQNYVGSNLASVGYTSMGGDRMVQYGSGYIELTIMTEDGHYIDIDSEDDLKQYVVAAQSLEPNTEIKYTFETDSNGKEYDNLIQWQNIEQIDLLVIPVGSTLGDSAPELTAITPSPDRYTSYIRNYVGKNAAMFGYESMSGKRMDEYGAGYIELNLTADDGTYLDPSDTDLLSQYVVTAQNVAPNSQITYTFLKDSSGEEYDNLIDTQNYEQITLNVTKVSSTSSAETSQQVQQSTGSGTGSVSATTADGVSADFKATMDTYEAFFDEYVAFMTDYDPSDTSKLGQYLQLLTTYSDYMQKMSDLEENDMSDADYAYFLEVYQRILSKLTTIL